MPNEPWPPGQTGQAPAGIRYEPQSQPVPPPPAWRRKGSVGAGLTTMDLFRLDQAAALVEDAWSWSTYLVGSTQRTDVRNPRDVDVRTILPDDEFDRLFDGNPALWQLACVGIGSWLAQQTGLPIDYQIQRQTEANAAHDGPRTPIGRRRHPYASGGDGTPRRED